MIAAPTHEHASFTLAGKPVFKGADAFEILGKMLTQVGVPPQRILQVIQGKPGLKQLLELLTSCPGPDESPLKKRYAALLMKVRSTLAP